MSNVQKNLLETTFQVAPTMKGCFSDEDECSQ